MKTLARCFLAGIYAVAFTEAAFAQQTSLQHCQKLKDGIDRYTQLRKSGGSGDQMDAWKRSRRDLEKQFRGLRCKYYRTQLE